MLPKSGRKEEDVLSDLKSFCKDDPDYKEGKLFSLVYYLGEEHSSATQKAYNLYSSLNGLNPSAFKSLKKCETDVINITASLHNGDKNISGVITSGGTESCLLAVKTYRDFARAKKGIRKPEMIIAESAHVAWDKGAEYFGVKIKRAKLDKNYAIDLDHVKKLISRRTIMLLASAPGYPHGVIDPVNKLGKIAEAKNIPLHVDACVGGFLLPFIEKNGADIEPWDWRVSGVTSISADIHKYGYAAKGASTITYRSLDLLKYQMFVKQDWPGGVFASPALLGTRPGGAYSSAWAALQLMGEEGYLKQTQLAMDAANIMKEGIESIDGIEIIGKPKATILAYKSITKKINIFVVGDLLEKKGWHVDRLQHPEALHLMLTSSHKKIANKFINDLRDAVKEAKENPSLAKSGSAATYGMIANLPLQGVVKKQVLKLFSQMYGPDAKMIDMSDDHTP